MKKFAIAVFAYEEVESRIDIKIIEAENGIDAIGKCFDSKFTAQTVKHLQELLAEDVLFSIKEIENT
jgi:hypothetical protein